MTSLAVAQTTWRTKTALVAHLLSIALVAAIPLSNSVTTVLSIVLPLTCLIYMHKASWYNVLRQPITIAILLFVALSIIAAFYSIGESKDITLALRKQCRLLYFLFFVPLFADLKWRHYANIAFLTATFISVVGALIYTWAFFKDPIFTSLFVSIAIFILAHYSLSYKKYRRYTIALALFFTFYLFFIGTGRVGQLLFFVFATLFMFQRVKFSRRTIILSAISLCTMLSCIIFLPSSFVERQLLAASEVQEYLKQPTDHISHESSLGIRFVLAKNTWELVKQRPFFGFGSGAFRNAYMQYAPEMKTHSPRRTNPHNQYLLTQVELGIPGLLLLLAIFGLLFRAFWQQKNLDGYLGVGLMSAFIIGCTMNSWILDVTSCFFFIVMTAVYAGRIYNDANFAR